jgi:vacuolar-type H+-ATPase subunit I/STV1
MTIDLSREAILVKATFHSWTGDKRIDDVTAEQFNDRVDAKDTARRHTKKLLSKSEYAANCRTIISNARKFHKENTVPWTYDGWGLLPKRNYERYREAMRDFAENKLYGAASLLFENFNREIEDDREVLGQLFDHAAYIMPHQVFERFKIDLQYEPIVNLDTPHFDAMSDSVNSIMEQARARQQQAVSRATDDLRSRVNDILLRTIDRLEHLDDKSKKPTALLKSIEELADVLPRLNIAGDTDIANAAQQMKERILYFSAQDLKDDEESRAEVIQVAREISGAIGRKIKMPVREPENAEV